MNTEWQTVCRLPEEAPSDHNRAAYAAPQLLAGSSPDARFIYDAVYVAAEGCFVLTLMQINDEWGFIEHEQRAYYTDRHSLLAAVAAFQAAPQAAFQAAS